MVFPCRFALVCAAVLQAGGSWASPDPKVSLSSKQNIASQQHGQRSEITGHLSNQEAASHSHRQQSEVTGRHSHRQSEVTGHSFRIKGGAAHNTSVELLTIPKGATGKDVLMKVVIKVEHMGPRNEDMWIRRVQVRGQWLKQPWAFKTGSGHYGSPELYQARLGDEPWTSPANLLQESDGLLWLAIHDKEDPHRMFQSSTAQEIKLIVGPVTVGVVWKTSNKDGVNFNHLDVHLSGLSDVIQPKGGILIDDQ